MSATSSLRQGLSEASRRLHLTVALYVANLAIALILAAPMAILVDRVLGRSVAAEGLASQFDLAVLTDFLRSQAGALGQQYLAIGWGAVLFAAGATLLTGGLLDTLKSPPRSPFLPRFFGGCGRLALRYLRLLFYLAIALLVLYGLNAALNRLIVLLFDQSPHEIAAFWVMRGKQALLLALLLLLAAVFDLARVLTALEDRAHMIGALLTASGFVGRHIGSILFLYSLLLLLGLAVVIPYLLAAQAVLPAASIIGLFLLQQVVMLTRQWFRVVGFASLLALYRGATGGAGTMDEAGDETLEASPRPAGGTKRAFLMALGLLLTAALAAAAAPTPPSAARPGSAAARQDSPVASPPALADHTHPGAGRPPLARRVVDYRIEASLDPATRRIHGHETILYRNLTTAPMHDLRLHLYPNAFANSRTRLVREAAWDDIALETRLTRMTRESSWGYQRVMSLRTGAGVDLAPGARLDETVLIAPLPEPISPGDAASVEIDWETQLPRTFMRMGVWGDHFDVMQWYPKMAVFTDAGWTAHPFHRHSEFFADFGTYEVTLTAPAGYAIEATGVPRAAPAVIDGTQSVTYTAEDVHDFAWVADRHARSARRVVAEGAYADAPVEIIYLHRPDRARMAPRVIEAVRQGLLLYAGRFMPYPYPRVVVDDLPMGLDGGMEYPMLFTISMAPLPPSFDLAPEALTLHEFGHQYWYGILATNEIEEPWLDEGINSYVTRRAMDAVYGGGRAARTLRGLFNYGASRILAEGLQARLGVATLNLDQILGFGETPFGDTGGGLAGFRLRPLQLDLPGFAGARLVASRERYAPVARDNPIITPAWGFHPGAYSGTVYDKTDLVLETLANLIGREGMDEVLRLWVVRHRFTHPNGNDFIAVLHEVAARRRPNLDLAPYVEQLIRGTQRIDFAVTALRSRPLAQTVGFLPADRPGAEPELRSAPEAGSGSPGRFETEVIVRQLGEATLPAEITVRFDNGEERREVWDGRSTWVRYVYETSSRAERAIVDPQQLYAIDLDRTNNGRTLDRQPGPVARLGLAWLFWLQNYLHLASSLS